MRASTRIAGRDEHATGASPGRRGLNGSDFLFSLYSLLLGLAVAHVATGFADSWVERRKTTLGSTTLLLALLILLRAAGQWTSFWSSRAGLTMDPALVLTALGVALPYVFIGRIAFPRPGHGGRNTDDHYMDNRTALMAALSISPCVSLASNMGNLGTSPVQLLWATLKFVLPLAIPLALGFSTSQRLHRLGLGVLVACTFLLLLQSS